MFKDSHLSVTETRVRLIRPDVAAVDVKWTMTGARDPHRQSLAGARRHAELDRHPGTATRWLIDVSHNMDLPSPDLVKAQAALSNR